MLPNVSRSKRYQTMKLSLLIKYNMKNIFLEKSYIKCHRKTSPSVKLKFYTICFHYTASWSLSKYIETKLQTTCSYLILIIFKKKKRSGIFCIIFEKNVSLDNSINWPSFIVWLPLRHDILGNMCIAIVS